MKSFKDILDEAMLEEKSVVSALNPRETKELVKIMTSAQPDISLQREELTDMFDKVLQHLLGRRDSSVIPNNQTEGGWMINQLEFDNKFMGLVRKAK